MEHIYVLKTINLKKIKKTCFANRKCENYILSQLVIMWRTTNSPVTLRLWEGKKQPESQDSGTAFEKHLPSPRNCITAIPNKMYCILVMSCGKHRAHATTMIRSLLLYWPSINGLIFILFSIVVTLIFYYKNTISLFF